MNNDSSTIQQLSAEEVKRAIDTQEVLTIIDVRTPAEYSRGNIQGSKLLPLATLAETVHTVIPDTNTRIVVYCLSGSRSIQAITLLKQLGYTNLYDMPYGLLGWRLHNYPLVT